MSKKFWLRKKTVVISIILIISVTLTTAIILIFYPLTKPKLMIQNKVKEYTEWIDNTIINSEIVQCKFDLKNPEYAIVYESQYFHKREKTYLEIIHFNLSRDSIFSQTFSLKRNGYTDFGESYTDFSSLVSLVKSDCNQFKQGYPSTENPRKQNDDSDIFWRYYAPLTEQEIEKQKQEDDEISKHKQEIDKEYVTWTEYINYIDNIYTVEKRLEMGKELGLDAEDADWDSEAEFAKYLLEQGVFGDQKFDEEYFRDY